jgi:adenylate kinase
MKKIFLGPPGSGKGTAASRIAPIRNVPHISTGDLFRENIKNKTEIGTKAKSFMDVGELVPDEIVIEMLKQRIENEDCKDGFILDGFPRTIPQAEKLSEMTGIDAVINLNVTDEIIIKRLCSRVSCKNCGEVFNLVGVPPKQEGICDKCSGELFRRYDDEPETVLNRLNIYKEKTQPLIDFYNNKGILYHIHCKDINQTAEETLQKILEVLENFEKKN